MNLARIQQERVRRQAQSQSQSLPAAELQHEYQEPVGFAKTAQEYQASVWTNLYFVYGPLADPRALAEALGESHPPQTYAAKVSGFTFKSGEEGHVLALEEVADRRRTVRGSAVKLTDAQAERVEMIIGGQVQLRICHIEAQGESLVGATWALSGQPQVGRTPR